MAIERVDSLFDIPNIRQEFSTVKVGLTESLKSLTDLYNLTKTFKDTTLSNLAGNSEKLTTAMNGSVEKTAQAAKAYDALTQKIAAQANAIRDNNNAISGANGSYENLIKAAVRNKLAMDELAKSQKEVKAAFDKGDTTLDQYTASLESIKTAQQGLKVSNQDITKGLNNLEKQAQSSGTSIDGLKAKLNLLTQAYDKLDAEERASDGGKTLLKNIQETDAAFKKLKEDTGRFQDSVGNYSGAFKEAFEVLKQQLAAVKNEMGGIEEKGKSVVNNLSGGNPIGFDPNRFKGDVTNMATRSGGSVNVAAGDAGTYQELSSKANLLEKNLERLSIGFKTTRGETRAFQEAAVDLGLALGQDQEEFLVFNQAVGEGLNGINDIKAATKFQAQDAKLFVGLVSAVNGLVGAFGAAQAAAGLLSDESEASQKQMQKLQQLLVLITGLQQVANTVQEESGAIQLILAARMNLTNAAKKIQMLLTTQAIAVVTAETTANEANAVSQEAVAAGAGEAAVAMEAEAVAATEGAAATTAFSTAFIATGIGAIILAVGAAIVYLVSKIPSWIQGSKLTTKEQGALADAMKGANDVIIAQAEAVQYLDGVTKRYYENQLTLAQASGQNQYKQLALQKQIAEQEKQLAQGQIDQIGATNAQQSELKGNIDALNIKRKEAYDIQVKFQRIPKTDRTGDQQDQLDNIKETIDLYDKQLASQTGLYDAGQKARQDLFAANLKSDAIELQTSKLTNDEERKITLETAKVQIEATKDKNQRILNDDASTLNQRLAALKKVRDAEKASAQADFDNTKNDPSSTIRQVEAAQIQLNGAKTRADKEYLDTSQKVRREYYERDRDARLEIYKTSIDESLRYEQDILSKKIGSEDDQVTGDKKIQALSRQLELQKQLIEQERQREIDQRKFSRDDKTANDEKLAINRKYDSQLRGLDNAYLKDQKELNREVRDATLADWDKYYEGRKNQIDEESNAEIKALNELLENKKISQQKYDDERKLIEDRNAISSVDLQVMNDYLKVQSYEKGTKDRLDAEKKLTEDLKQQSDQQLKNEQDKEKIRRERILRTLSDVKDQSDNYSQAAIDILDVSYNTQKAHMEELEAMQQEAFETEVKNISDSSATEEQKAIRLKILDDQRAVQKQQNDRKQRQLDIQKAQFDKAKDVLGIITSTALAVVKALPNIPLAVSVGVLGAAELAAAIATPLPHYMKGTKNHPGGDAVVGDGGEHELILEPGKDARWSPDKPTVMSLLPHTKVIPPDEIRKMIRSGMFVNQQGILVQQADDKKELRDLKDAIIWQTQRLENAANKGKSRVVNNIRVDTKWGEYLNTTVFDKR
jgi:hypothetical protein